MKKLFNLSDESLLHSTKVLVQEERDLTLRVLHHLREVERRQLFAELGFPSLFAYATQELGYSEGAAHRRIASMRLLACLPEIEEKMESGRLPLSTLAQAQCFFRQEKIQDVDRKREVLSQLEGHSHREVEKILAAESSEPHKLHAEKLRPLSGDQFQLQLVVSASLLKDIEELRALLSHRMPHLSFSELFELCMQEALLKHRVKAPKTPAPEVGADPVPAPENAAAKSPVPEVPEASKPPSASRAIPAETRRRVWARDGGCCSYVDEKTGRRCDSRHFLEVDHVQPWALGGSHDEGNLRLLCSAHNRLAATQVFGREIMETFVPGLRRAAQAAQSGAGERRAP